MATAKFPAANVLSACIDFMTWAREKDEADYEETLKNMMAYKRKRFFFFSQRNFTRLECVEILSRDTWNVWGYWGGGPGRFGRHFYDVRGIMSLAEKSEGEITLTEKECEYLRSFL